MVRSDRTAASNKKGGGGLILYYKDDLDIIHLTEYTRCTPDIECIWLGLHLINTKLIVIGLIYRPPSGKVDEFVENVEDICLSLCAQRNCEINFGGDINLDFNKTSPDVRKYKDSLKRMGLTQTISDITHVVDSRIHVSLIVHFVTSDT